MDESDVTLARIHEGTPVADFRRGGERGTRWEDGRYPVVSRTRVPSTGRCERAAQRGEGGCRKSSSVGILTVDGEGTRSELGKRPNGAHCTFLRRFPCIGR